MKKDNSSYTILVNTCDAFEDCWSPFFTLLLKNWESVRAPVLLNTETKLYEHPGMSIKCARVQGKGTDKISWSECLIRGLKQVETPLVLYFQEDYFIDKPVRSEIIDRAASYMLANPAVKHIGLTSHGSHGPYEPTKEDWLLEIRKDARYRISAQTGLWRVDTLLYYLRPVENAWMFEIFGTWRAARKREQFLCVTHKLPQGGPAVDYLHTGIIKGKWHSQIKDVFEKNEIEIDYSIRGFYVPKNLILRKWEVGRLILQRPSYFIKQLLGIDKPV